jgi:uncharacterized protein involved in exopolysaccharide biosynthesis
MEKQLEFSDISQFIARQKKIFLVSFLIVFLIGAFTALILPPLYLSKAVILVQEQQIPEEFVQSGLTSFAEERIQTIRQRVLSRPVISEIIQDLNPYPEQSGVKTDSELIEKFQNSLLIESINAEILNRRTGRQMETAVAFSVAYENENPVLAQKVTERVASLFLEEESKAREQKSEVTTKFFESELSNLKKEIQASDKRISDFKKAHIGELPESQNVNLQTIQRLESDLQRTESEIRTLQDRKFFLEGELATLDPLLPVLVDGEKVAMNPSERLKRLYLELISMRSRLSEKHPDVKKLKREIVELEAQVGQTDTSILKIKRLNELNVKYAEMEQSLGPAHPDVVRLSNEISILEEEIKKNEHMAVAQNVSARKPDNPEYIRIKSQINSITAQISNLTQDKNAISADIARYQRKIEKVPLVEKEYNELIRDYENSRRKYDELYNKLMEAKVAKEIEATDKGEHFILKSPAFLPEKPYKPNRMAILIITLASALFIGFATAIMRESVDDRIRTTDQINRNTGLPVLSVIPQIVTKEERRSRNMKRIAWAFGVCAVFVCGIIVLDQLFMSVDDLLNQVNTVWNLLKERLGMIV